MPVHGLKNTWINVGKHRMNLWKNRLFFQRGAIRPMLHPFAFLARYFDWKEVETALQTDRARRG